MYIYFTSDDHFDHEEMVTKFGRPFKTIDDMNETIIRNHNQRVKKGDLVYHVGDFCFKGGVKGGKNKALYWEEQLNGKIVHIYGNHDYNNTVKSCLKIALMEFGGKQVLVQHEPPLMREEVPAFCDFVICGHMHAKWKYKWLEDRRDSIPIINVGVDVWSYRPVRLDEVLVYYDSLIRERDNG
jgi:calcineurin-like phosphoesterase family protein